MGVTRKDKISVANFLKFAKVFEILLLPQILVFEILESF